MTFVRRIVFLICQLETTQNMAYQTVIENEWATIRYNDAERYLYHTFHKPITGEPFRTVMNAGLAFLEQHKVGKWLSDDRLNGDFTPEDIEFALADWGPRAAAAGWKYWALVVPESLAGRESMSSIIMAFAQLGVRMMVFTDLDKAKAWVIKQ